MKQFSRTCWSMAIVAGMLMFCCSQVSAQDRIRRRTGVDTGKITDVSVLSITISKGGVESKVPVEEIRSVYFSGEPAELNSARLVLGRGRFEDALEMLGKIDRSAIDRNEIIAEVEFLLLQCQAKIANAGQGDLQSAIGLAKKFLSQHRRSYHVSAAIELLGSLFLADGNREEARRQYAKLAKAPAAYFKARSALLTGKLLQEEGEHSQSLEKFDEALASAAASSAAGSLGLEITLQRAVSQAATGQTKEAIAAIEKIVSHTDAEETELLAHAYNALGECYLQTGENKAACDAFLHVDVLFSSATDLHAKALHELTRLWEILGYKQRSQDARQRLQQRYPTSRWAKQ